MVKDILCHTGGDVDNTQESEPDEDWQQVESASALDEAAPEVDNSRRAHLAKLSYNELTRTLIHAFIGTAEPYRAQVRALADLQQGQSVLAVMGTGRGKSLIFQVHAAREAIVHHRASIFVYPCAHWWQISPSIL